LLRRHIEKLVIRITRSMSLRGKIVLFYGLIVLLPTVLLAAGAGYFALLSARSNYMNTISEAVRQSVQSIEFRKQSYDLLAMRTATDGELISRLSRSYGDMVEQLETVEYVDRSFPYTSKYLPGIEDFRIYHSNPTLVEDGGLLWKPGNRLLAGLDEAEWYERMIRSPETSDWSNAPNDRRKVVVTRKMIDGYGNAYGVVYLLLDYSAVFEGLLTRPFNGAGELYILEPNGHIIASSQADEIGNSLEASSLKRYWQAQGGTRAVDGRRLIVQTLGSGWSVAALIHMDRLEEQSKRIWLLVGGGTAFFLLLSAFLIMIVLKNVVLRIRKLGIRMMDVSQGVFDVTVKHRGDDELGELELLFNSMAGRLGKLVEDITQARLKEQELAFRALQAQINPHFIYNSLGLIRWRAMDAQDETQLRAIDALTAFYRLALDNRTNLSRVLDELEHVRAYVDIQQLRYPGRVDVQWEVDPDALELYTIKLLLQPIVENCYKHGGVAGRQDAAIRIAVRRLDDAVLFEVFDNGRGMSRRQLERLRSGGPGGAEGGFGLRNIRDRLALYFGAEGKLSIDSAENEWTVVSVRIPVCRERPEAKWGGNDDPDVDRR
jgi:two-component system sensor histidine kinase YesM